MATKATHISNPVVFHVSSTLLGRTKLQQVSTNPTPPPAVHRPSVRRPTSVHHAGIGDFE